MTKREVLTNVICAYISKPGAHLPIIGPDGKFSSPVWENITEAICKTYPERDKTTVVTTPRQPTVF